MTMLTPHDQTMPDWMIFVGKWGNAEEGHPLVYHMLDSAAVAEQLWQEGLTKGSRAQFAGWLGLPEDECGRLLAFWTSLHDLGKAAPSFQMKHRPTQERLEALGYSFPALPQTDLRHHSLLSQWILEDFKDELQIPPRIFHPFRIAIGGHHGTFHYQEDEKVTLAQGDNLGGQRWKDARRGLFKELSSCFLPPVLAITKLAQVDQNAFFQLLTGFFVAADWLASQDELFHYQPAGQSLPDYLEKWARPRAQDAVRQTGWGGWKPDGQRPLFSHLFDFPPYPLQQMIIEAAEGLPGPFLMIVEAPTGSGKTEAALVSADRLIQAGEMRGCYVAMPTQATSDQMFERMRKFLERRYSGQEVTNLQLVHGNAILNEAYQKMRLSAVNDLDEDQREGRVNALEWFLPRKRSLLAPFGVGTVDQTFFSVLRVRHAFLRLFGLHRKIIIFDEVHAYDTYMLKIFTCLLAWLRSIGSSVILLSATLPDQTRIKLLEAFQKARVETDRAAYPRMSINDGQVIKVLPLGKFEDRRVQIQKIPRDPDEPIEPGKSGGWLDLLREKLAGGGCAAVICNTVDRAQKVFSQIRSARIVEDDELILLHARMPYCWREAKEHAVKTLYGKLTRPGTAPRRGIVVATQIIEQSLDLDFDLMITDLAPVDLLIQRIGRLHRHTQNRYPPLRPAALQEPVCLVCQPEAPPDDRLANFRDGSDIYIYDEAVLQRTYFTLLRLPALSLPADSDWLINQVYSEAPLEACSEIQRQEIAALAARMRKEQDAKMAKAANHLIGDPAYMFSPGEKAAYLSEEDGAVEEAARAMTRDMVLPAVQLVCFVKKDGKTYLLDGNTPAEPQDELGGAALKRAMRSMVSVNNRGVVDYFRGQERNPAWSGLPSLRKAYAVVFEDGRFPLSGGVQLFLDQDLGLVIEKPGRA